MLPTLRFLVFALSVSISSASATEDFNVTNEPVFLAGLKRNGEIVYMREELAHKLEEERETWHWTPWMRTRIDLSDNVLREADCVEANSIESFPEGPFTDDQLLRGAFLLYALFGIYAFTLLALNVAAATFMAVATSFPEFFVNVIATFVTESDMGIGTIVGSAIFNALGVGAVGSLAAIRPIKIEMSPVTRDVLIYMINASVLVAVVWDGQVDWYEALVLAILYVLYFILMFNSVRLFGFIERRFLRCCKSRANERKTIQNAESDKPVEEGVDNKAFDGTETNGPTGKTLDDDEAAVKPNKSIFRFPKGKSWLYIIWWMYTWPIKLILGFTVPSPVTYRKFYPFAFFMCIVWIGTTSYCVTWSMTVIGEGGIGVSNALGANSLAILFALGLPWLIKTLTLLGQGEEAVVYINSNGIDFVIGSLLVAVSCLWIVLFIGKFTLRKSVGAVLAVLYITFITFAILVELGIILDRMDAFC
ncbi:hypothetical protein MSG28_001041 [Choristoneura fumiferana]|uniref:Uncharacterized protein n=1 Tax=Choristoneura fumiferana TaxID=7141 RepID=A0ACC0K3E8_CHOFU|nr:hypothetical protein MSG28_001041 [Choristoneura fumiferana]